MNIIRILMLLLPVSFVYFAFVQTKTIYVKVYQRILFLGFIAFVITVFIIPHTFKKLAVHAGLPGGIYLLVYVFVIAFIFSIIAIYLKFDEMSHKIVDLSRKLALLESKIEPKKSKK